MADKDEIKKESIEEILADLNDILNKMPYILDGIKPPENAPAAPGMTLEEEPGKSSCPPETEPPSGRAGIEAAEDRSAYAADMAFQEKPAPEPAPRLEEKPAAASETMDADGNFERIIDLENIGGTGVSGNNEDGKLARPPEADAETAEDTLVLQTLGESMFSAGAEKEMTRTDARADLPASEPETEAAAQPRESQPPCPPAGQAGAADAEDRDSEKKLADELNPVKEQTLTVADGGIIPPSARNAHTPTVEPTAFSNGVKEQKSALEEAFEMSFADDKREIEKDTAAKTETSNSPYAGTRDFGVPDIDILMKMSQTSEDAPQVLEAPAAAQAESPAESPVPQAEAAPAETAGGIEKFIIEPSAEVESGAEPQALEAPAAAQAGNIFDQTHEEGPSGHKSGDIVPDDGPVGPLAAEGGTVEFKEEDLKNEESVPAPTVDAGEGIQLEPRIMAEPDGTLSPEQNAPVEPAYPPASDLPAGQTGIETAEEKPLVLEPAAAGSVPSADAPPPQPEEEHTMLIVPTAPPQPEEEKTVMYEAGADLSATGRSKGDIKELSVKTPPEGIPENRLRTLALLYVEEDAELCAGVLAELDAICLKSSAKPMFIQRGFVKVCETGMNGNYVLQMASDVKAVGLLCVGSIPSETVYEIENVLSSSGVLFKHVQRDNFSHSAMLDLVTELILR